MQEVREKLRVLMNRLKNIQDVFSDLFGVEDIYSNSKTFEVLIADTLGQDLIPGHSGSRDAKNSFEEEFEYKHYKETSCNHTWTFNDFSDITIQRLHAVKAVIFAHINDTGPYPIFDWYYEVPGKVIADYLENKTRFIQNVRKMINVSPRQIEREMKINKNICAIQTNGTYTKFLKEIFEIVHEIEKTVETKGILTSNKFWEILIGAKLGHQVLSKQTEYDAIDQNNNYYEYKVSKTPSFNFEDISENVLNKFANINKVILAVVNKEKLEITVMYEAEPLRVVERLKEKLEEKRERFTAMGKEIRRLQVSLSKGDLERIGAVRII